MADTDEPRRKRRTREHVIEDLSENYLEHKVLLKGHVLRRPERDYSVDVTMFHFAKDGQIENGEVRFQLKATDRLQHIKNGKAISFPIRTGDLHYWALEIHPFILVVFDARAAHAFWLHIQPYVAANPDCIDPEKQRVQVHIPTSNKLTVRSIDQFRKLSVEVISDIRNQGGFPNDASPSV